MQKHHLPLHALVLQTLSSELLMSCTVQRFSKAPRSGAIQNKRESGQSTCILGLSRGSLIVHLCDEWNELSKRPYFHRVGIVEELSGARHRTMILCGQDVMEWTRVVSLGWRLHRLNLHSATSQPRSYMDVKLMMLNDQIHSDPM